MAVQKRTLKQSKEHIGARWRNKVLAADLAEFPDQILEFDDDALRAEGMLELVKKVEATCFSEEILKIFDTALVRAFRSGEAKKLFFRYLCLVQYQNALRAAENKRLNESLSAKRQYNEKLLDELYEGTLGFDLACLLKGTNPFAPENVAKRAEIRKQWREKKAREADAKHAQEVGIWNEMRKRSGKSAGYVKSMDWTESHTIQEYVDAIGEKSVHAKRVRSFLTTTYKAVARRRGISSRTPLEYPAEAGFALFDHAVNHWVSDPSRRSALILITVCCQAALPSALSENGRRFRATLERLWLQYCPGSPPLEFMPYLLSEEGWREWNAVLQPDSKLAERMIRG